MGLYIQSQTDPINTGNDTIHASHPWAAHHTANISTLAGGWSGGAMVLGKLPVPGRPTIWITVGQGPTALAVGAGGVVWTF